MNKYYITAAIPYVNAKPHIGHALEFIQVDTLARYHRLIENETLLLSGGDENALKNVQAAAEQKIPIQEFVDKNNQLFHDLTKKLNCQFDVWQKGSSSNHHIASQKLWNLCDKNGDIYEKKYKGLYCLGCELFYTKEELNERGECFEHPGKKLEEVEEKNYFFRLSKYQDFILDIIKNNTLQIIPEKRKHEILSFVEKGLEDISISRSNERAKNWGVPVPNDPSQRMYVWLDALNIYQSGVGFGWDEEKYKKWWPADAHVIGKGILRFHAVYWPAFLRSAGLLLPKKIFVHEYLTVNGQKMSKTLGNVIDPLTLVEKYGADSLRYYFLAKFSSFSDGDFSENKFKETYNADLANGIGNLVARVAKMSEKIGLKNLIKDKKITPEVEKSIQDFEFDKALKTIWNNIREADLYINEKEVWKLEEERQKTALQYLVDTICQIAVDLRPFISETAEKILKQFNGEIKSDKPLFPRIV